MSPPWRARRPSAPWTALIAALTLLVQGAFPSWALARAIGDAPMMVRMCSQDDTQAFALSVPAPERQPQHDCCDPFVFAAALPAPGLQVLTEPVRYADPAEPPVAIADAPSAKARDPPRPPSRAPPQTV